MAGFDPDLYPQVGLGTVVRSKSTAEVTEARRGRLDQHPAAFETAAEPVLGPAGGRTRGRPPQAEEFS
jgi:hypothetical protein